MRIFCLLVWDSQYSSCDGRLGKEAVSWFTVGIEMERTAMIGEVRRRQQAQVAPVTYGQHPIGFKCSDDTLCIIQVASLVSSTTP